MVMTCYMISWYPKMCVCVYVCSHTHTQSAWWFVIWSHDTLKCVCVCMYVCMYVCSVVWSHDGLHKYACIQVLTHAYRPSWSCVCVYVCMYVCMYVSMYVNEFIQREIIQGLMHVSVCLHTYCVSLGHMYVDIHAYLHAIKPEYIWIPEHTSCMCQYVCMWRLLSGICIYVYMSACMYVRAFMYVYFNIRMYVCKCMHVCMLPFIRLHTPTHTYMHGYVECISNYDIGTFLHTCMHTFTYLYIQTCIHTSNAFPTMTILFSMPWYIYVYTHDNVHIHIST
jgi:hypothetical protein